MVRMTLAVLGLLVLAVAVSLVTAGDAPAEQNSIPGEQETARKTAAKESATQVEKGTAKEEAAKDKEAAGKKAVTVEWYGQACFLVKAAGGAQICIDPFNDETMPYSLPEGPVTLAFSSHEHFDHNNVSAVKPKIAVKGGSGGATVTAPKKTIKPYGTYTFSEDTTSYALTVVPSYHDEEKGEKRGHNIISVWEIDGLRIVHLGDLGCGLDGEQVKAIGRPDVLLIPVGGYYTIDAEQARAIVNQLSPRIVVPMHFKTKALGDKLPISGVEGFLEGWKKVTKADGSVLSLTPGELPEGPEVVLLKYHGQEE